MNRFRGLIHLGIGVLAGIVVTVVADALALKITTWQLGWFAGTATYAGVTWASVWRLDGEGTRQHATAEEVWRPLADVAVLAATAVSVSAIGLLLVSGSGGKPDLTQVGVSVLAIVGSWVAVHTMFAMRYARTYYAGEEGGVNFHSEPPELPQYSDFAYLAFTVAMTFQVSDDEVTDAEMRRRVLGHAFTSFFFVAVILAVMINVVGSIAS